ncbi:hypothetical protein NC652_005936 [Populus alba x Populus x berolinensis]|nr:hypothetical protein NC652_005936 [Populus alba x Populus x berolinensis]
MGVTGSRGKTKNAKFRFVPKADKGEVNILEVEHSNSKCSTVEGAYNCERSLKQMEGLYMYGNDNAGLATSKRVMVVVDHTSHSKHAMMWALTHLANKGDLLSLLHIIPPSHKGNSGRTSGSGTDSSTPYLASSLGSLCKASRPEPRIALHFSFLEGEGNNFYQLGLSFHRLLLLSRNAKRDVRGEFFRHFLSFFVCLCLCHLFSYLFFSLGKKEMFDLG